MTFPMSRRDVLAGLMLAAALSQPAAAEPTIWRPAETPPGGVSWKTLESTKMISRLGPSRIVLSKPEFPPAVAQLAGKQVVVAGWMMPLESGARQRHFVLFGYPPGCPFHDHAGPNQFIEVYAAVPVPVNEIDAIVLSGVLELSGHNEDGVFYKLRGARQQ